MPAAIVDGHDFFAVYEAAGEAIQRARSGGGPSLIEVKVNRYFGHFEGDQQTYRGPDEVKKLRETKDCLVLFHGRVTKQSLLSDKELDRIDEEVRNEVEDDRRFRKASAQTASIRPADGCLRCLRLTYSPEVCIWREKLVLNRPLTKRSLKMPLRSG